MTQTVEAAEAVVRTCREALSEILNKCAEHEKALAELGRLRAECSFDAHMGNATAQRKLEVLHRDAAKAESVAKSFEAAISEGQRRVTEAEQVLDELKITSNARDVIDRLDGFRARAADFDQSIKILLHAHAALLDEFRQIHALGCGNPTETVVRNNLRRALLSALIGSHLQTALYSI
jgi:hypothetical protein